jgi:hypothetical protein
MPVPDFDLSSWNDFLVEETKVFGVTELVAMGLLSDGLFSKE